MDVCGDISGVRSMTRAVEAVHANSTIFGAALRDEVPLVNGSSKCPCWWLLDLDVREIADEVTAPNTETPTADQYLANGRRRGSIYFHLRWSTFKGSRSVRMDIAGGGRFCVFGSSVDVSLFSATSRPLRELSRYPRADIASTGQLVTWTRVVGWLEPQTQALELRFGQFTVRQFVTRDIVPTAIEIPEDATSVQIFEDDAAGGAPTNVAWRFLGFNGVANLGQIPIVAGASERVYIPNSATQVIATGGAVGQDRLYSVVFRQRW